jgi:biotin carboxyl carrier protein
MNFELIIGDELIPVVIEKTPHGWEIELGDEKVAVDAHWISENALSLIVKGKSYTIHVVPEGNGYLCYVQGELWSVARPQQDSDFGDEEQGAALGDKLKVKAPMPGKVIKINVEEGEAVRENQTLAVVEAMKMENEIKAAIEGRVKKILVSVGELVDADRVLIELEET